MCADVSKTITNRTAKEINRSIPGGTFSGTPEETSAEFLKEVSIKLLEELPQGFQELVPVEVLNGFPLRSLPRASSRNSKRKL